MEIIDGRLSNLFVNLQFKVLVGLVTDNKTRKSQRQSHSVRTMTRNITKNV